MAAGPITERNQDATIYVGGLDEKASETLLWELFVQAGPVANVHMPKDRITQAHQGYGFVEFLGEEDANYAIRIMNMIKLFGKPIRVNKASSYNKNLDVGANLFIGNLDPEVDEKLLYDTFSAFGVILQTPKIMRDLQTGNSKGFAFVNFATFDASDAAIEAMNGQHLANRAISVSYAFKKDTKGERHGSAAERLLAAQNPLSLGEKPHQMFADAPAAKEAEPASAPVPTVVPPPMMPPPMVGGPPPMMPPPGTLPPPGVNGPPPPPQFMPPPDWRGPPPQGPPPSGPPPPNNQPPPMMVPPPGAMPPGMGAPPPHFAPPPDWRPSGPPPPGPPPGVHPPPGAGPPPQMVPPPGAMPPRMGMPPPFMPPPPGGPPGDMMGPPRNLQAPPPMMAPPPGAPPPRPPGMMM
ncbi:splicing factor 3B subunit 4-like [Sycon ciliatum]|uniref:splicing factor 3B subunit 4-like n=1 Tax=Sycon ciliatum TaxID=27933 RepID=UPI0031F6A68D|eukprot:scpid67029/ scgid8251/ Splicing factor 3B subunit 4; Pre-mRNA-splicing factor SF3b 49 kDa subunit; SF3b50; Spliceosome-associated protein 49